MLQGSSVRGPEAALQILNCHYLGIVTRWVEFSTDNTVHYEAERINLKLNSDAGLYLLQGQTFESKLNAVKIFSLL